MPAYLVLHHLFDQLGWQYRLDGTRRLIAKLLPQSLHPGAQAFFCYRYTWLILLVNERVFDTTILAM